MEHVPNEETRQNYRIKHVNENEISNVKGETLLVFDMQNGLQWQEIHDPRKILFDE